MNLYTASSPLTAQLGVEEPGSVAPLFEASLAEFLGGLAVIVVVGVVTWAIRRRRQGVRRYTLLNSTDADGNPVLHVTTRRAGTVIRRDVGRGPERFELTSTPMGDGTYVAEPLDRYV
ncbi:hypothetical protein OG858_47105 (plasmid) [Streptomyces europaeiscabiei]|uniref:hypothetical protein n=1 Tax=Streptomyces europaeiscabiei TaxID=146819 RepID=UPI002E8117E5|nr:hypothetical protein [Streptomyces europaeiscabiei]WUD38877.1 hypothetical protein OG858_47105 [Streptomyces europaeiscabiei]